MIGRALLLLALLGARALIAAPAETPEYAEFDGVVTLMRTVDRYFFAQATDGRFWRIDTEGHPAQRFAPGDLVHVRGMLERPRNRHTTRLFNSEVTKTGHDASRLPALRVWQIADFYRHPEDSALPKPDWYASSATVEGYVRDFWRDDMLTTLIIEDGEDFLTVKISMSILEPLPEYFAKGARVRVAGVALYNTIWSDEGPRRPVAFGNVNILAEGGNSLEVLSRPPFWTVGRILLVALALVGVFVVLAVYQRLKLQRERIESDAARRERLRLACDLHDDFQQLLASTSFRLLAVKNLMPDLPELAAAREQLALATKSVEHTQTGLRTVLWSMTEESEGPSGLKSLFEYAAGRMAHWAGVVTFAFHGEERPVTRAFAGTLLMILQEAIGNAIRHGGADHVKVNVLFLKESVVVAVRDDGSGFEVPSAKSPEQSVRHEALGLRSMRERAEKAGGEFVIQSEFGKGTIVKVRLPL